MHGVSAYGLLVQTGRHSTSGRRKLVIALVATIVSVAVIDFEAPARASGGVVTTSIAPAVPEGKDHITPGAALPEDRAWAADESRRGTRPDAAH